MTPDHHGAKRWNLDDPRLDKMSRGELARLLLAYERHTPEWRRIRSECERRSQRWSEVAKYAWIGIWACIFLVALATLVH